MCARKGDDRMQIEITEKAREMILDAVKNEDRGEEDGIRVTAQRGGPAGVMYGMGFIRKEDVRDDDLLVECDGIRLYIDPQSATFLEGAKIEYVEEEWQSGFKIDGPPPPKIEGPIAEKVQKVIEERINPSLAGHGGWVALTDVKDDKVYIQMGGGCQGCGMAHTTMKQGVEVMIKEEVPEVSEVLDATDHAGGANPYYKPSE
jgi:Fe/S biogenesis protein NfuA